MKITSKKFTITHILITVLQRVQLMQLNKITKLPEAL